jgi:sarcosine oxidase
VASESYERTTSPAEVAREVTAVEVRRTYDRYIQPHFNGLSDRCVKTATCLYTVTPDYRFVIDRHPEYENVIIASPCSGHGFKHSAAIGEVLAELVTERRSRIDVSRFGLERFA